MKLCGIYLLTHTETGRTYVGQSLDIHRRWKYHARGGKNTKIGAAILKYGWKSFTTEILELCAADDLNNAEMKWVSTYDCVAPKGFNLTSGGSLQTKYSDETRAKIAAANAKRVVSEATREKMRNRFIGPETRQKISDAKRGKPISAAHAAILLATAKAYAHINIPRLAKLNTGRKLTAEHVAKTVAAHTGAKRSAEACANISAAKKGHLLGVKHSKEHRAKVSAALMGHKHSDETRAKIGQAAKGRKQTPEHIAKAQANKAAKRLLRQSATVSTTGDDLSKHSEGD